LDSFAGTTYYTNIRTSINGGRILFESFINFPAESVFLYQFFNFSKNLQVLKLKSTDRIQYQIKLYSMEVILTLAIFIDSFIAVINPTISVLQPLSPLIVALKWSDLLEFGVDIVDILKQPQASTSLISGNISATKTV